MNVYELIAQFPFMAALLALVGLGLIFGALLGFAAEKFKTEGNPIVDQINDILPQTQCGQCGFPGCRPYAEAIAAEDAPINQCPPGGEAGIAALADLLDVEAIPLDEEHGGEKEASFWARHLHTLSTIAIHRWDEVAALTSQSEMNSQLM